MPAITSLGIGSGVDINAMVEQLVAIESRPLLQLRSAATSLNAQVSAYGTLSGLFSSLQSAANKLTGTAIWQQASASSSDSTVISVTGGSSTTAGNYAVSVQALAASQTTASLTSLSASTDLVGSGSLTIELGQWASPGVNFTPNATAPITLAVTSADTLADLRDKINAAGAGVNASIVTDTTGVRLALTSTNSGASNGFRITSADDDGLNTDAAGLSRFAYDPPSGTSAMEHKQAAKNAQATINGIVVTSASNEISTAIEGATLTLHKESASAVVTVATDRTAIKSAIQAFADAYNAMASNIATQTAYNETTKVGGVLQGDGMVGSLVRQMRDLLNAGSGASATFPRLSEVGLEMQRDGTLRVNATKLDAATANLTELKKAFSNSDTVDAANDGFARRYADLATQWLGLDGGITARTSGLKTSLERNTDDQERVSARVARYQERLVAQYTAMDANLARLNSLSAYMTQQLAMLTASSSGSNSN
jgi:flagellar hook-associated protein 2